MKRPGTESTETPTPKRQAPPASANLISLASPQDLPSLRSSRTHLENLLKDDSRNAELKSLKDQVDVAIANLEKAEANGEVSAAEQEGEHSVAQPDEEAHEPAPPRWQGVVVSYSGKKGFGFIRPTQSPDGPVEAGGAAAGGAAGEKQDVFVHKNAVVLQHGAVGLALTEGQAVSFVLSSSEDGRRSALDVRAPDGEPLAGHEKAHLDLRAHTESWRGLKDQQEDRYVQGEDMGDLGMYYAVFDGHGGIFTPEYLCKHLHRNLLQHRAALPSIGVKEPEMRKMLTDVFVRTDKELLKMPAHGKAKDGSTALITILSGQTCPSKGQPGDLKLYVANAGDCRAVLCRGGRAVRMSEDHKPNRGDEERRVRAAGGYVVNLGGVWRVTTASGAGAGVNLKDHQYLAVSRSFGDVELKQPNQLIVSTPEIKVFDVTEEDCFFVLACDGIWDMLDDQEVVDIAGEYFGRPQDAAASIVRTAYQKGSGDNLTATVVEFGWVTPQACKAFLESFAKSREGPEEDLDMFGD